jgi:chromate reductase
MSQYKIAVVVGSLRRDSLNRKLATGLAKLAPPEFEFKQLEIGNLPLYNQDDDANQADVVKRLKADITASQGVVFVTAEYNRSLPGCSRMPSTTPRGPTARTPGQASRRGCWACRSARSVRRLRSSIMRGSCLAYLDPVPTLGQPEVFIHATEGCVRRSRRHRPPFPRKQQENSCLGLAGSICTPGCGKTTRPGFER